MASSFVRQLRPSLGWDMRRSAANFASCCSCFYCFGRCVVGSWCGWFHRVVVVVWGRVLLCWGSVLFDSTGSLTLCFRAVGRVCSGRDDDGVFELCLGLGFRGFLPSNRTLNRSFGVCLFSDSARTELPLHRCHGHGWYGILAFRHCSRTGSA